MQEITVSDIKSLIIAISNHLKFLCDKKVIKNCEYFFDLSLVQETKENKEELLFDYINLFFVDPIIKKIERATTIREHKELLEELKFISEEIKVIVQEFFEQKRKQEEEYRRATSLSLESIFSKEKMIR